MADPGWISSDRSGSGGWQPEPDGQEPGASEVTTPSTAWEEAAWEEDSGPSHAAPRPPGRSGAWGKLVGKIALGVVSLLVLGVSGYAWAQYSSLDSGIRKSSVLAGEATSTGTNTNILIMGLDTRLDENGNPLPQDIYQALQAGNQDNGGNNSNVLMLLHVPGDGSRATSISIPRDDYVSFPGCPYHQCTGKIKEAYGLAFAQKHDQLVLGGMKDQAEIERESRDAGRKEEIDTVRQFIGGEPIDHFIEITMVAFFEIAQVVQPITICVNENTRDYMSNASFHKGVQQINAIQAVEFVRQRRDINPALNFTDLDRERRQQAFISSLAYKLKQAGTFADPSKLAGILNVAKQNIAVDSGLNLLRFAQQATNLTSGNIQFVTLPITAFATRDNQSVNLVNLAEIQSIVRRYIGTGTPPSGPAPSSVTVDVVNANGRDGLAGNLEQFLGGKGYAQGETSTDNTLESQSTIYYSGDPAGAVALSKLLGGMPVQLDSSIAAGHVEVVLGADFPASTSTPPSRSTASASSGGSGSFAAVAPSTAATPVPVPPPSPTSTSVITGGGIPCVK